MAVTPLQELDSIVCPLDGVNLIEAAAGTGKTYNIQNLFVRLIVEQDRKVGDILIVTYTEAAAAELRDRARRMLAAVAGFTAGNCPAEEAERCRKLLAHAAEAGISDEVAGVRLSVALRDFDDATISTIHGFCQKVLSENAFESGVLFNSKLEPDTRKMVAALCADFYRRKIYPDSADALTGMLLDRAGISAATLMYEIRIFLDRPEVAVHVSGELAGDADFYRERIAAALERLRDLALPGGLNAFAGRLNKGYYPEDLERMELALGDFALHGASPDFFALLGKISPGAILENAQKKQLALVDSMLDTPFFDAVGELQSELLPKYRITILLEAVAFVRDQFERLKQRDNFQTFDDLLRRVHRALKRDTGLLTVLREKFKAGIIDEFQDTDTVQYEIFSRIFAERPEPAFFMVGDPRQAIYGFRGGDLATYFRADRERAAHGGRKYALKTNYRSAAPMIAAVNRIFAEHPSPFAESAIGFPAVNAPEAASGLLRNGQADTQVLRIHRVAELDAEACSSTCADQILALLQSDWSLPGREKSGILPSDIAVLVFENKEAEWMKRNLARRGIPAVFTKTGNVFASAEAKELLAFLQAPAQPQNYGFLANALATSIGGMSYAELRRLHDDPSGEETERQMQRFTRLGDLWRGGSFIEMFQEILHLFDVRGRYPRLPDGERRLTNLLQLGDILQQQSARGNLSVAGLLAFLAAAIREPDTGVPEYEQLLETDRAAVRIMTIHGSKGLEFPIVMLPGLFRWYADQPHKQGAYHNQQGLLEYDLSGDPESKRRAEIERLQELLRLAYVALTRAKYRCHVWWGSQRRGNEKKPMQTSALDWLFRQRSASLPDDPVAALIEAGEPEIPPELRAEPAEPTGGWYRPPVERDAALSCPTLPDLPRADWKILSFSAISPESEWLPGGDAPHFDHDQDEADDGTGDGGESGIFAIPGGAAVGNAWHRILELADFDASREELREIALAPLLQFGVLRGGEEEREAIRRCTETMLGNVLHADFGGFTLAEIGRGDRLSELEFHFQIRQGFTEADLIRLLDDYARSKFRTQFPAAWHVRSCGGFFNGFIDLIFRRDGKYSILDWKSNRLNGIRRNFEPSELPEAMAHSFYFLQYLIYLVALVKYLRLKSGTFGEPEYERMIGGVYYCFLRGVSVRHPGRGIFFDRPPWELVHQLEQLIG